MVDVFDEASARREAHRTRSGEFGAFPLRPPELEITDYVPTDIAELYPAAVAARDEMSLALINEIDATMPADAGLVNYDFHPGGHRLVIREAIDGFGEELDLTEFAHIDRALGALGQPYADFDGDLVLNSLDDFGWERSAGYDLVRAAESQILAASKTDLWAMAITAQQNMVIKEIWTRLSPDVEAVDFAWDEPSKSLTLAAVIHSCGRTDISGETWPVCNNLAAYITEPQHTPMQLNELSGLYRLSRG